MRTAVTRRGWTGADDDDGDDGAGTSPRSTPSSPSPGVWKDLEGSGRVAAAEVAGVPPEGTPPRVPAFDRVALALARLAATCVANSRVAASSSGHALSTYRPSTPPRLRSGGVSSNDDDSGLSVTLVAPPAAAPTPQSRSGSSSSAGSPRARSAEFFAGDKKAAGSSPSLHSVAGIDASDAGGGGGGGALLAPAASATSLAKATHAAGVVGADAERPVASVALSAICGVEKKKPPFSAPAVAVGVLPRGV